MFYMDHIDHVLYGPYRSCSIWLHVPSPLRPCALARKGGPGGLAPQANGLGSFAPQADGLAGLSATPDEGPLREAGGFGGRHAPQLQNKKVGVVPQYD